MSNTNLQRIKQSSLILISALTRLKSEKEQVQQQYQIEKDGLQHMERELEELRAQADFLSTVIQEKEEAVNEFNLKIQESEKAYGMVDDLSHS